MGDSLEPLIGSAVAAPVLSLMINQYATKLPSFHSRERIMGRMSKSETLWPC